MTAETAAQKEAMGYCYRGNGGRVNAGNNKWNERNHDRQDLEKNCRIYRLKDKVKMAPDHRIKNEGRKQLKPPHPTSGRQNSINSVFDER